MNEGRVCYYLPVVVALLSWLLWTQTVVRAEPATIIPGGTITTDTTWAVADSPFTVEDSVTVTNGATLTVEPGVVVQFNGAGDSLTVDTGSTLSAVGTAAEPIIFTSSIEVPSRWDSVVINPDATATLQHCEIRYGGWPNGGADGALHVLSSNVSVSDCIIRDGGDEGIVITGDGLTPSFTNVEIRDNGRDAIEQSTFNMQPTYQALTATGNGNDAIVLPGGTLAQPNVTFAAEGLPYEVTSNVTVPAGTELTLEPGVTWLFNSFGDQLLVENGGTLTVVGSESQPIVISGKAGTPRSWQRIYFAPGSTGNLQYCEVINGGWWATASDTQVDGNLFILSSDVSVRNCHIHRSDRVGIRVDNAQPTIKDNIIADNQFGLINKTPATQVDATLNYWGHESGPYHPDLNPGGQGNEVSDGILFNPWYSSGGFEQNNLAVVAVSTPADAVPGDDLTVTYTVENGSNSDLVHSWVDSVYLSADTSYDPDDLLLGRLTHTDVAAGSSYEESLTAPLRGVLTGDYYVIVIADSRRTIPDPDFSNNERSSDGTFTISIPTLMLGDSAAGTVAETRQRYFKLELPPGSDVLLAADFNPTGELYLRHNAIPTRSEYDHAATAYAAGRQEILLTNAAGGTWYVMLAGEASFTVSAEAVTFRLQAAAPLAGGNLGPVTVNLTGIGFTTDTQVRLTSGATTIEAVVEMVDAYHLIATFDLAGVPLGNYTLTALKPGDSASLSHPFEVVHGRPAELHSELVLPWGARPNIPFSAEVVYENVGDVNMPIPILIAKAPPGGTIIPPGYTMEEAALSMQFLALPAGSNGDQLPPHVEGQFAFSASIGPSGSTSFTLTERTTAVDALLDYETLRQAIRPPEADADWDSAWQSVVAGRTTYGDLLDLLIDTAQRSDSLNLSIRSLRALLTFAVSEQLHQRPAAIRGTIYADRGGLPVLLAEGDLLLTNEQEESFGAAIWHDGTFAVRALPPGSYQITVPGYRSPSPASLVYDGSARTGVEITVAPAGSIEGIVRSGDAWFDTVSEAQVVAIAANGELVASTETDTWGRYTLGGLPLGQPITLTASHDSFAPSTPSLLTLTTPQKSNVILYVKTGGEIYGTVTNAGGQPLGDVTVRLRGEDLEARTTRSDAGGSYIFRNLVPGSYTVEASHNGSSRVLEDLLVAGAQTSLEANLELSNERQLAITVQDQAGIPIPNALIDIDYSQVALAATDAGGQATISGLPEGEITMLVEAGGALQSQLVTVEAGEASKTVTLHPFGSVSGTITRPGGGPAEDITVTLSGTLFPFTTVQTGANGQYQFDNLPDGQYTLSAGDGRNNPEQRSFTVATGGLSHQVDIQINFSTIPVHVVDAGGTSLENASVTLLFNNEQVGFDVTDAAGRTSFLAFTAGDYTLVTTHEQAGWERSAPFTVALAAGLPEQTLTLDEAAVVLTITAAGQPVSDALVALVSGDMSSLHAPDTNGVVRLDSVVAGTYTATVSAQGFAPETRSFTHGSAQTNLAIPLSPTALSPGSLASPALPLASTVTFAKMVVMDEATTGSSSRPQRHPSHNDFSLPPLPDNASDACKQARRDLIKADNLAEQQFLNWEATYWNKSELNNVNGAIVLVEGTQVATDLLALAYAGPTAQAQKQLELFAIGKTGDVLETSAEVVGHLANLNALQSDLRATIKNGGTKDAIFTTLDLIKTEAGIISSLVASDPALAAKFGAAGGVISTVQDIYNLVNDVSIALEDAQLANNRMSQSEQLYEQTVRNLTHAEARWEILQLLGDCSGSGSEPPEPPKKEQKENDQDLTDRRVSRDPNDILGPHGYGPERWIQNKTLMLYTIQFENVPTATAPAQLVSVQHSVPDHLDYETFEFEEFGFGEHTFPVPGGRQYFQARIDLVSELGYVIEYTASFNRASGVASWELKALDPETGDLSSDPEAGFLPPNANAPEGEGFVRFSIRPKPGLATGTTIDVQARIVFDTNDPIDTPVYRNTIDAEAPASAVAALPDSVPPSFTVSWSGSDAGAGIVSYDIYVSADGGPYEPWLAQTAATSATYQGVDGSSYRFYSVARDGTGQRETVPGEPDATTSVSSVRRIFLPLISR